MHLYPEYKSLFVYVRLLHLIRSKYYVVNKSHFVEYINQTLQTQIKDSV